MDSYSYTASNSESSSSSSFQYHQILEKSVKPPPQPPYLAALHSVRKAPAKTVITKKPIAPLPPTGPRVYKVDPVDFRDVVQRLTGAQPATTRLKEAAPPPLSVSGGGSWAGEDGDKPRKTFVGSFGAMGGGPLGFSLSPSSIAWCSSILLSPRALSSLDPSPAI